MLREIPMLSYLTETPYLAPAAKLVPTVLLCLCFMT